MTSNTSLKASFINIPPLILITSPPVSVLVIYQGKDFLSFHNDNNDHFLNSVICFPLVLIQE